MKIKTNVSNDKPKGKFGLSDKQVKPGGKTSKGENAADKKLEKGKVKK